MLSSSQISSAIEGSLERGHSMAIVTLMADDAKPYPQIARLIVEEGARLIEGTLGSHSLDEIAIRHALALIADERREIAVTDIDHMKILFEISRPPLELIICGGGHVGQAVAKAGRLLDFNVNVIDDRTDFASRDKFPDPKIGLISDDFVRALNSLQITPASHIVIVTRGHRHDEICLHEVIDKPARYIGMIGSRRRTTTIRERLKREGVGPESLRRVHAPIGLDIGAQTPEEIAVAILAEIVLVRRGGTGRPKSHEGPMAKAR